MLAANRDERVDRPWDPPAAWWAGQPDVTGGRDRSGGGTWMAMNERGVVACILNRPGSLGPAPGKRSRGELPLLALKEQSATAAAATIAKIDAEDYRSFNMVLADREGAIFQSSEGFGPISTVRLPPGVHMVTAHDVDDWESPRIARHLPRFRAAATPDPAGGDWRAWTEILADPSGPAGSEINVPERAGFGTVCSALVAIPEAGAPFFLFAPGPPDRAAFGSVHLSPRFTPSDVPPRAIARFT